MAVCKAKIGDHVKIIKKLPYQDQMNVELGDIGIINYIAATGKYSVHIDGKKNPHDDDPSQKVRCYGKKYDFWIPSECCEVIDNEELTRQCLFENADALDVIPIVTIDDIPDDIKELIEIGIYTEEEALAKCTVSIVKDNMSSTKTNQKKEVSKMIRNQKVVDLYFERKQKTLVDAHVADVKAAENIDPNRAFVNELKKQFEDYIEANPNLNSEMPRFNISLPLTENSSATIEELKKQYSDNKKKLDSNKEEILAMLSGCETYEQEMSILRNYGIVDENNKLA